jgi:hypothetical protein
VMVRAPCAEFWIVVIVVTLTHLIRTLQGMTAMTELW